MAGLVGQSRLDHEEEGPLVPKQQFQSRIHHVPETQRPRPVGIIGKDIGEKGAEHRLLQPLTTLHMRLEILPSGECQYRLFPKDGLGLLHLRQDPRCIGLGHACVVEPFVPPSQHQIDPAAHLHDDLPCNFGMKIPITALHLKGRGGGPGHGVVGDRSGGPSLLARKLKEAGRSIRGIWRSHSDDPVVRLDPACKGGRPRRGVSHHVTGGIGGDEGRGRIVVHDQPAPATPGVTTRRGEQLLGGAVRDDQHDSPRGLG